MAGTEFLLLRLFLMINLKETTRNRGAGERIRFSSNKVNKKNAIESHFLIKDAYLLCFFELFGNKKSDFFAF